MAERLTQWDRGRGFAAIRLDWLERAASLGETIRVVLGAEELDGRFDGLDEAGHLVLHLRDGTAQRIAAGDVFPLDAVAGDRAGPRSVRMNCRRATSWCLLRSAGSARSA